MLALEKGEYTGEIIKCLHLDGSIVSTTYSTKKSNPDWHYHKNLHMCFVFQGGKAETRRNTIYTKKNGTLFFYFSGETHRWITPNQISKSANIEINSQFLKRYNLSESGLKQAVENNIDSKLLILKMQKELAINDTVSNSTIETLVLELTHKSSCLKHQDKPNWIILLTELLHDKWNRVMPLKELSKRVGVHPVTISKFFRKYYFCTLGEYQRKLKINYSLDLIKNSRMSLTEIAFYCGFTDQSHFTRTFKEVTTFLPKQFRTL